MLFIKYSNSINFPATQYDENDNIIFEPTFSVVSVGYKNQNNILYFLGFIKGNEQDFISWFSNNQFDISLLTESQADNEIKSCSHYNNMGIPKNIKQCHNDNEKQKLREKINQIIGDDKDNISDLTKMICLIFGSLKRIYEVMPTEQKNNIDPAYKAAMEYSFSIYSQITTIADMHWQKEGGTELVSRIFERQNKLSLLISEYLEKVI